jgi:hypothetical protein
MADDVRFCAFRAHEAPGKAARIEFLLSATIAVMSNAVDRHYYLLAKQGHRDVTSTVGSESEHQVPFRRPVVGQCSYLHELYKFFAIRMDAEMAQFVFNMDPSRLGKFEVFIQSSDQNRRDPVTKRLHDWSTVLIIVKIRLETYWGCVI